MATVSTFVMLMASFDLVVTARTAANLAVLSQGALLATGPRTVTACLRAAWPWVRKHWSAYHNVLGRARLDVRAMAHVLFGLILGLLPRDSIIELAVDDTLVRRYGPRVVGVGMHHDTVRSSHGYHAVTPGHKWVVVSVIVRLPFGQYAVALPLLSALYSTQKHARRNRQKRMYRRHRTVQELALLLVRILVRWAPGRRFRVLADGAYATHELTGAFSGASGYKALRRVRLVSRLRQDAATWAEPPAYSGRGRPRVRGQRLPTPEQVAAGPSTRWERITVQWYGGTRKVVTVCWREGLWYKSGTGGKRIRWVLVRDPEGRRRDEVFFTTDLDMKPGEIIESYVRRWPQEVTFEEVRTHLGLETLRNWSARAVVRSAPLVLGLYSLVVVWYALHVPASQQQPQRSPWYRKGAITFSDMLAAAREDILTDAISRASAPQTREHLLCEACGSRIVRLPDAKRAAA
jgi:hypothetical protein